MTIFDELKARGLLAQLTDEEEIKEMINNGKATFYIGFDPTADSLHVGHFMALCLMKSCLSLKHVSRVARKMKNIKRQVRWVQKTKRQKGAGVHNLKLRLND